MKANDKKKLIYKIFKRMFLVIFVAFTALYLSQATGYYEYQLHSKVILTNDKIKQFEEDVKLNKDIDIDDYVAIATPNYENSFSNIGLNLSKNVSKVIKNCMNEIFKGLSNVMTE